VWPIGFSHIAICAFFFFLVWEGQWGPSDAQRPFEIMSLVYTMALLPLTYWALKNSPRVASPWECRRCGYLLFGLTTPRCPECGEAFDPALLEQGSLNP
jgi:hypothetical protein